LRSDYDWKKIVSLLNLQRCEKIALKNTQVIEKPKVHHPMILQLLKWEAAGEPEPPKEFGLLKKDLEVQDQLGWDSRAGTYPNHPLLPRTYLVGF
jgi:hypothetical protein